MSAILAGGLMTLAAIHLVALRKAGNAGPWDEKEREEKGPFWPDQVFKDGLTASLVILLLIALSVFAPPPFAGMADPLDASYIPKPEWNFLFFYEALKFFPGPLEVIATIGIPVVGTLILLLLPFFDRDPERSPGKRPLAMAGWVIVVAGFVALTVAGAYSKTEGTRGREYSRICHRVLQRRRSSPQTQKQGLTSLSLTDAQPATASAAPAEASGPIFPGKVSKGAPPSGWETNCATPRPIIPQASCPPLRRSVTRPSTNSWNICRASRERRRQRLPLLQAVAAATSTGPQVGTGMAVTIIGSAEHGAIIFAGTCSSCHGPQGTGGIANPGSKDGTIPPLNPIDRDLFSPDPKAFAEKIDPYIQHGSRPEGPNPQVSMLPFGDSNALTQQQIADIEAYILSLNGVDRARINHPGLSPDTFFIITAFAFALVGLNLCGWWWFAGVGKRQRKEVDK